MFDPQRADFVIEDSELVIPRLAKKGYRMLMIANGSANVLRGRFLQWPFAAYFEHLIISEEVGVAKPDPTIFDIALQAFGNSNKDDVMIIGANLMDNIQGGIDYGVATCWWNPAELETVEVEIYNSMHCYEQLLDLV